MLTASFDNYGRIWDATNGTNVCQIEHKGYVRSAVFSPDGSLVATASDDGTVGIAWKDPALNKWLSVASLPIPGNGQVRAVKFSPDSGFLAAGADDGTVAVWKVEKQPRPAFSLLRTQHHKDLVNSLDFTTSGTNTGTGKFFLVSASADQTARLWKLSANDFVAYGEPFTHQGNVQQASFSPDGRYVVTASDDGTAGVWQVPLEISWTESMYAQIGGAETNQITKIGEALTGAISGFYFNTNSGQIQQLEIEQRLALNKEVKSRLGDHNWSKLYRWWLANSENASTENQSRWP